MALLPAFLLTEASVHTPVEAALCIVLASELLRQHPGSLQALLCSLGPSESDLEQQKMLADSVSGEDPLPALWMALFSLRTEVTFDLGLSCKEIADIS